jgi:hypothetical protein
MKLIDCKREDEFRIQVRDQFMNLINQPSLWHLIWQPIRPQISMQIGSQVLIQVRDKVYHSWDKPVNIKSIRY